MIGTLHPGALVALLRSSPLASSWFFLEPGVGHCRGSDTFSMSHVFSPGYALSRGGLPAGLWLAESPITLCSTSHCAALKPWFTPWSGRCFPTGSLSSPFFFPAPNVSLGVLPSGSCFLHKRKYRALEVQLFNGKSHFSFHHGYFGGAEGETFYICVCPIYVCHLTPVDSLSELQFIHMQNRANDSTLPIS